MRSSFWRECEGFLSGQRASEADAGSESPGSSSSKGQGFGRGVVSTLSVGDVGLSVVTQGVGPVRMKTS